MMLTLVRILTLLLCFLGIVVSVYTAYVKPDAGESTAYIFISFIWLTVFCGFMRRWLEDRKERRIQTIRRELEAYRHGRERSFTTSTGDFGGYQDMSIVSLYFQGESSEEVEEIILPSNRKLRE